MNKRTVVCASLLVAPEILVEFVEGVTPPSPPNRQLRMNSSEPLSDPECLISSDKKKRGMDGWWIKEKEAPGTKRVPTSCKHAMKYKFIV